MNVEPNRRQVYMAQIVFSNLFRRTEKTEREFYDSLHSSLKVVVDDVISTYEYYRVEDLKNAEEE